MSKRIAFLVVAIAFAGPAAAHHGWGSYDAANPVTVTGSITLSKFESPHATIAVKGAEKTWTVTLAPPFRMSNRGANAEIVATGKTVTVFGYPSTVTKEEMRAERLTIDGKTYELR